MPPVKIDDKTVIPLGLALMAIGGGSMWLTNVQGLASEAVKGVVVLNEKRDKDQEVLQNIRSELVELKTILKEMRNDPRNRNRYR